MQFKSCLITSTAFTFSEISHCDTMNSRIRINIMADYTIFCFEVTQKKLVTVFQKLKYISTLPNVCDLVDPRKQIAGGSSSSTQSSSKPQNPFFATAFEAIGPCQKGHLPHT